MKIGDDLPEQSIDKYEIMDDKKELRCRDCLLLEKEIEEQQKQNNQLKKENREIKEALKIAHTCSWCTDMENKEKEIYRLKEELKKEREVIDKYADHNLYTGQIGKKARLRQKERTIKEL